MSRSTQIDVGGKKEPAQSLDFKADEPWVPYKLEDGTEVRIRTVVVEIVRADQAKNPDGSPAIAVKAQVLIDYRG